MQITYSTGINSGVEKKYYHQQELHLTPRDFDILKFILEMKFASLEDLARKFFWRPKEYPNGPTLFRTRDRLYKLQINKLIVPERYPREKRNHFMVSWKGFYALDAERPNEEHCKPLSVTRTQRKSENRIYRKRAFVILRRRHQKDILAKKLPNIEILTRIWHATQHNPYIVIPDCFYTDHSRRIQISPRGSEDFSIALHLHIE